MNSYKDFLEGIDIINEDTFNNIMSLLPQIEVDFSDIDYDLYDNENDFCRKVMDLMLLKWSYAFVDVIDMENRTIELGDVSTLEDLEEIKETFKDWTISNYDFLKNDFEEEEQERSENSQKEYYLDLIKNKYSIEKLKELALYD